MKVFIGYLCYYDGCNVWQHVNAVFDDEAKALVWKEDFISEDPDEYRTYEEWKVE